MKLEEIRKYAKENKINHYSTKKKEELIDLLISKGVFDEKDREIHKDINYDWLKYIRGKPRSVEIYDRETGNKEVYHSIYAAGKKYCVASKVISKHDGKLWRKRYEIRCREKC